MIVVTLLTANILGMFALAAGGPTPERPYYSNTWMTVGAILAFNILVAYWVATRVLGAPVQELQ